MRLPQPRLHSARTHRAWRLACVVASALAAAGSRCPGSALLEARDEGIPRRIAARVSLPTAYRPCRLQPPAGGTIPRAECGPADLPRGFPRDTPRDSALVDLLWSDGAAIPLQRSLASLQGAARHPGETAPALADLAAAYLLRAERTQDPSDLLRALEAAENAVVRDPRDPAAAFNRALALDRLALDGEALRAWRAYLAIDSASGWGREAASRIRALSQPTSRTRPPLPGDPARAVAAYAAREPEQARLRGWAGLGEWGEAMTRGDTARAALHLAFAARLGEGLERRGGDATLSQAVRALAAASGDSAATRELAGAHHAYAAGSAAARAKDSRGAVAWFARALTRSGRSPALRAWTMVMAGPPLIDGGERARGERLVAEVLERADTLRQPALAARARAASGSRRLRDGHFQEAVALLRAAAALYGRAGEGESRGMAEEMIAEAEFDAGDGLAGYTAMHQALLTFRPYRDASWLHTLLYASAAEAAGHGMPRAALRLQDEGVAVADRTGNPLYRSEARVARARLYAAAGQPRQAAEDLRAAQAIVDAMPPSPQREWVRADRQFAEAQAALPGDPRRSAAVLDSVVRVATRMPIRLFPVLVARAEARLAAGNAHGAEADLERAIGLLDRWRDAMDNLPDRARLLEAARMVYDRSATLRLSTRRPVEALAAIERGRVVFGPSRGARGVDAAIRSRPGEVVLDYAVVGDTLLAWTIRGAEVGLTRTPVGRERLARVAARTREALELGLDEAAVRPELETLFDWLVRPVLAELGPDGTPLVIVADGVVAGVPFAALHDRGSRGYLVERHPVRYASTAAEAARRPSPAAAAAPAVLVSDPAFDPHDFRDLGRLPFAAREVAAIAPGYGHPRVLADTAAGRGAVLDALRTAAMLHYAGHAVFDDGRPEHSYLVLAARPGDAAPARLTAAEIGALDTRRLRLVVLSACQTSRSVDARSGGFAGLAGAFLAGGAGGVVGSLWSVDDRLTLPLMTRFHDAYRASGDPARALQAAQLQLLRDPDPALRSPAAWAGFRYLGT